MSATGLNGSRQIGDAWVLLAVFDMRTTSGARTGTGEVDCRAIGSVNHAGVSFFDDVTKH
jgi:hypothetical protein